MEVGSSSDEERLEDVVDLTHDAESDGDDNDSLGGFSLTHCQERDGEIDDRGSQQGDDGHDGAGDAQEQRIGDSYAEERYAHEGALNEGDEDGSDEDGSNGLGDPFHDLDGLLMGKGDEVAGWFQ